MPQAPLKDSLDNKAVAVLAGNIQRAWPSFDAKAFRAAVNRGLAGKELKERVTWIREGLATRLPASYPKALAILVKATAGWKSDPNSPFRGFSAWPLFEFVSEYGQGDYTRSMAALRKMTHLFTAEFAIRPFIERYPERAFADLARWTTDESDQVRRLVSEGTRPRLPWAAKLPFLVDDPSPIFPLLEKLKDDPSLFVRRSVANNLNDISKDHGDRVVSLCKRWQKGASSERQWIIERATRTLVKSGHPKVYGLLGFTPVPKITVAAIVLESKTVHMGKSMAFSTRITSVGRSAQRLVVDYIIHFQGATSAARTKVFKLKTLELAPGQSQQVAKQHSFRPISTRKYYPGRHAVEIVINGTSRARADFSLKGRAG